MTWICSQCGEKFSRFRTRCSSDGQRVIEDFAGQLIGGRYRIRELVGIGGMDSTVWKAWQTGTERVVAVKVLPVAEEAAAKRFARGARIAANLNHPNCTVVHDYGRTDDGKLFLVMEYLHGQVLQEILGPEGMSAPDTIHVADQVLQALEHAHGQRAVHRDLKPDNLFLSRKNDDPLHVKILDFGIAKYVEEDPDAPSTEETPSSDGFEDLVTEQRQVCGTPQYMAPEQVVGARIDGRTDLYSLGVVMYRMLTGRLPFDGKTRYDLYQKHLQEVPRTFAEVRPDLVFPPGLEEIVFKALSKRPDQRFQSAPEMRQALAGIELPDDRLRRGVRPRVSFRHTSPQAHSELPKVSAGGMWTLREAPPDPLAVQAAMRQSPPKADGDVAPPPLPSGVLRSRQSILDPADLGLPPDLSLASLSPQEGQPEPPTDRTEGTATDRSLLNDAVVRHPAGRSSLAVAPEVPRSTETEPNRARQTSERRRRRLGIAAMVAAAFLLGVGAVALVTAITGSDAGDGTPAEGAQVAATPAVTEEGAIERSSPSPRPQEDPGQMAGKADPAGTGSTAAKASAVAERELALQELAKTTTSGTIAGHALSEIPVAPKVVEVPIKIESDPPGAIVSEGSEVLGPTPLEVEVKPGKHVYTIEREGFVKAIVEIDATLRPGQSQIARKLVLSPERRPVVRPYRPRQPVARPEPRAQPGEVHSDTASGSVDRPAPTPTPEAIEKDPPVEKPAPKGPQVKLLGDEPTAPPTGPKKPTIKLLGDDADDGNKGSSAPDKKPNVNVLGD